MLSRYVRTTLTVSLISQNSVVVTCTVFNEAVADPYCVAARPPRHAFIGNATRSAKLSVAGKS